jgi:hypothetical protein
MKNTFFVHARGDIDDDAVTRAATGIFTGARYLQMLIWAGVLARHREMVDERLAQMASGMKEYLRGIEYVITGPAITETDIGEVTQLRELARDGRWAEAEPIARRLYRAVGGEDTEVPAEGWSEVLRERLGSEG